MKKKTDFSLISIESGINLSRHVIDSVESYCRSVSRSYKTHFAIYFMHIFNKSSAISSHSDFCTLAPRTQRFSFRLWRNTFALLTIHYPSMLLSSAAEIYYFNIFAFMVNRAGVKQFCANENDGASLGPISVRRPVSTNLNHSSSIPSILSFY